jgi:hypothetical protein
MTIRFSARLQRIEQALRRLDNGAHHRAAADAAERWLNLAELIEAGHYDALVPSLRREWAAYGELAQRVAHREGGPPAYFLPAARRRRGLDAAVSERRRVALWVFLRSHDEEARPATLRMIDLLRLVLGNERQGPQQAP